MKQRSLDAEAAAAAEVLQTLVLSAEMVGEAGWSYSEASSEKDIWFGNFF